MKRPHSDPRYYNCAEPDSHGASSCNGRMVFIGTDAHWKKQGVYECLVCGRKAGEASLLTAYNQLKRRD
jgi:tRNA(Phe) wybutosine-synthesizing methylase Tyw3